MCKDATEVKLMVLEEFSSQSLALNKLKRVALEKNTNNMTPRNDLSVHKYTT